MSGTYFDILPQEVVITILCNFNYDRGLYSLINILDDKTLYRKICIRIFPEMVAYPEKISVDGIKLSWKTLYQSVIIYADDFREFDKYEFYLETIHYYPGGDVIILLLWDYLNNTTEEMLLFMGTFFKRHLYDLIIYHIKYFKELIDSTIIKRNTVIKEKIKSMDPVVPPHNFTYDMEGNKISVDPHPFLMDTGNYDPEIILIYPKGSKRPKTSDVYKRGYEDVSEDYL